MASSQTPSNATNDTHSLEETSTVVEVAQNAGSKPSDGVIDTTTSSSISAPASAKPSLLRRLWKRFNVYLLLFIIVILVAIGTVVVLLLKSRDVTVSQNTIDAQNLSESTLKQLASSTVTVGNAKQILNVASSAVFAGAVLMRGNLDVAGGLKIGGDLSLPGITVSGNSHFGQLQADELSLAGNANVLGSLTVHNGMNITGNSNFAGSLSAAQVNTNTLQLNGDLTLTRHVVAGGPIPTITRGNALGSGGTVSLNGSDTAGSLTINTGGSPPAGCFATITFVRAYTTTPHVIVSPVGVGAAGLNYYLSRSTGAFSVCTTTPPAAGDSFGFDYMVLN